MLTQYYLCGFFSPVVADDSLALKEKITVSKVNEFRIHDPEATWLSGECCWIWWPFPPHPLRKQSAAFPECSTLRFICLRSSEERLCHLTPLKFSSLISARYFWSTSSINPPFNMAVKKQRLVAPCRLSRPIPGSLEIKTRTGFRALSAIAIGKKMHHNCSSMLNLFLIYECCIVQKLKSLMTIMSFVKCSIYPTTE